MLWLVFELCALCLVYVQGQVNVDPWIQFFKLAGGEYWRNKQGWGNTSQLICTWHGVTCDQDLSSITGITLDGNNLTGDLSRVLDPVLNGQYGNPAGSLGVLDLSDNFLCGTMPELLSNVISLAFVYFNGNNITGSIPVNYGELTSLVHLQLHQNQLHGTVPAWTATNQLNVFTVHSNQLTGVIPNTLIELYRLVVVDFHSNSFEGTIPAGLVALKTLYNLNLGLNKLSGTIPGNWSRKTSGDGKNEPALLTILLNNNRLTGTIPDALQAVFIDLSHNDLSGPLPNFDWACAPLSLVRLFNASANPKLYGDVPPPLVTTLHRADATRMCPELHCPDNNAVMVFVDRSYCPAELQCECSTGYFGLQGAKCCTRCGEDSLGLSPCVCYADMIQGCWPLLVDGNATQIVECPLHGGAMQTSCNPNQLLYHDINDTVGWCAQGYTNRLCSECAPNYYQAGRLCLDCNGGQPVLYTIAIFGFMTITVSTLLFLSTERATGLIKSYTFYVQTLGFVFSDRVQLTTHTTTVVQLLTKATIMSFSSTHLRCFMDIDIAHTFAIDLMMPVFYIFLVIMVYHLGLVRSRISHKEMPLWKARCFSALVTIMLLYHFPLCVTVARAMSCTLIEDDGQDNDSVYLNFQPYIQCSFEDAHFRKLFIFTITAGTCWLIGLPLLLFKRVQWLRNADVKLQADEVKAELAMVMGCYRENTQWWEIIAMLRRTVLALTITLPGYTSNPILQVVPSIIALFVSLMLQWKYRPFANEWINRVELMCGTSLLVTYLLAVFLEASEVSTPVISAVVLITSLPVVLAFLLLFLLMVVYRHMVNRNGSTDLPQVGGLNSLSTRGLNQSMHPVDAGDLSSSLRSSYVRDSYTFLERGSYNSVGTSWKT
eukprot:NODE_265_length_2797_cov_121.587135_g249_i0.p1 GENE.NODE_265_length_2797_cov_121.587135_g249_i0~~NODE_265_length_2797_cov_121.587135_g249_i0.p1  ORF type:complete len:900 (-),score=111.41 NODE_265_length_2797_cov_121.587135_g249_i0:98-2746(-)